MKNAAKQSKEICMFLFFLTTVLCGIVLMPVVMGRDLVRRVRRRRA